MLDATVLFVTKLLPVFVYPLGLGLALVLVGVAFVIRRRQRTGLGCVLAAVALVWSAATPAVANWAVGSLEQLHPPRPIEELPSADSAGESRNTYENALEIRVLQSHYSFASALLITSACPHAAGTRRLSPRRFAGDACNGRRQRRPDADLADQAAAVFVFPLALALVQMIAGTLLTRRRRLGRTCASGAILILCAASTGVDPVLLTARL